jgi:hypothetical protein
MQEPYRRGKIRFAGAALPDENSDGREIDRDIPQAFEIIDADLMNHRKSLHHGWS